MRVGVIGGGLAGLVAAYELSKKGHRVSVFERDAELGGQAGTFVVHGERLEKFYHHIFTNDSEILDLMAELGLADELEWLESRMGFFYGGKAYPFGTPASLLRFTPLSLPDRMRFGLLVLYLQRFNDWKRLENETAFEWVRRNAGRGILDVVWGPLMRGKFGDRADQVSMTWLWGKVHLRGKSRSGGMQKEQLGYLPGSFQRVADALARAIAKFGGSLHTSTVVRRVMVDRGRVIGLEVEPARMRSAGGAGLLPDGTPAEGQIPFDAVVATVPSPVFLRLVPELPAAYADNLRSVEYQSAVCVVLELNRQLTDIYWMNISDRQVPFVGAIEHTNFVPRERYGGKHILYLSNYLAKSSALYSLSDDELVSAYLPHLTKFNPDFDASWIERYSVFRDDAGQPIITTGYSSRVPEHQTPISGLYLANTTQIYPEDRGMNYSVRLGKTVARLLPSVR
ncbi:MAG: NAD(P)/FAD-dependent oxidoreductase [Chloroflexota bacterium]